MKKFLRALCATAVLVLMGEVMDLAWLYNARATITTTASSVTAVGNGATTVFTFSFVGVQASDLSVIYTDASGNQTVLSPTQYTISLNPALPGSIWGIGGTVTYPLAGSPIASGTTLTISRNVPYQQTVSSNQGQLFSQAVEMALDLLDMQIQQVNAALGHSIVTPVNDTCATLGTLPPASQRANQLLGFDSTGCNPIAAQPSSALVSAAMQPVVAAPTIAAANNLLGINTNFNTPVGAELDWPGLVAPAYWHLEDGTALSRTTYSTLLAVLAPVVPCTITNGSSTITGISSTVGWGTGWVIESPGSSALGSGKTIASVGGSSVTITGGNPTANATSCQIFPYGTAQDGTFALPNSVGVAYAALDSSGTNLTSTYCGGNPGSLNAQCGNQSRTLLTENLPAYTPTGTVAVNDARTWSLPTEYVGTFNGSNADLAAGSTGSFRPGTVTPSGTITASFTGTAQGGTSTPFSSLPPMKIRNKIIFLGAPAP